MLQLVHHTSSSSLAHKNTNILKPTMKAHTHVSQITSNWMSLSETALPFHLSSGKYDAQVTY